MPVHRAVRYRCDLASELEIDGQVLATRLLEVSEHGAFLEEPEPSINADAVELQSGDLARLAIPLPGGDPWFCEVVVLRPGSSRRELRHPRVEHMTVLRRGYGIAFSNVPEDELERLRDFLELLDSR